MKGERWEWFRVASHLKIPVAELKARITYSEFADWLTFLIKEQIERDMKQEYYLAQIAAEVRRGWVANPRKVQTKDFIIELKPPTAPADRIKKSKSAWGGFLGIRMAPKKTTA
jgi:hypothetical protein